MNTETNKMSVNKEEPVEVVKNKFKELCRELNMDRETEDAAWNKYLEVSKKYSLGGDRIHWLCCALYSACRVSHTPTVGGQNAVVIGNCVSLNMLLRSCSMSIYQFFKKMKSWNDMASLSPTFLAQVDRLERIFGITLHLFKRYNTIFEELFLFTKNEKNKKYRMTPKCSSNKLYELCWCLYLCAKSENPSYAEEIIHSLHLLICCIDFVYVNVLSEKRIDLINPKFKGLPENWNTPEFDSSSLQSFCIIEHLCEMTSAVLEDSKLMKENLWRKIILEFFRTRTLHGNEKTFSGIVSNENFDRNLKSLKSAYEQFVLSAGEFDERILLNNNMYRKPNHNDATDGMAPEQEIKSLNPETPLLRRNILPSKETTEPVTNATDNVKKLQEIAHFNEPTEFIKKMGPQILEKITFKLSQMEEVFYASYPNPLEAANRLQLARSEAISRFNLSKSLYFYLLEKIIRVELRTKPNIDLKVLFDTDTFNTSLFACCIEIVLDAYNSQKKFPWVLKCFNIPAFHFCKIIEIVVRRHDNILNRSLIKHLNFVEESCLESLIWEKESPVWEIFQTISHLPSWSDVDVSNIARRNFRLPQPQSPLNSAYDTFTPTIVHESARRDLFNTAKESPSQSNTTEAVKRLEGNSKPSGSLTIFLRKFYKLAWIRIKELCCQLDMSNELFLKEIWTIFEYSITHKTELMQDRHVDQILMCAIYIYIRVSEVKGKQFTDIMKFYRKQPQANSSIYRSVLMDQNERGERKHDDIICFYNKTYVSAMSEYARKFSATNKSEHELLLSPHPTERQTNPTQLTSNTPLTVEQMDKNENLHSPNEMLYKIGKSPAKDLEAMNETIRRASKKHTMRPFSSGIDIKRKKIPSAQEILIYQGMIQDRRE